MSAVICRIRDYGAVTVITAESPAPTPPDAAQTDATQTPERATLAGAIDAQARRMDQLSAAIVRATSQVTWSGRAAERFRACAAERSRECLQLAVALRTSAERVHAAATAAANAAAQEAQHGKDEGRGHTEIVRAISGMVGSTSSGVASGTAAGAGAQEPAQRPAQGPAQGPAR